MDRLADAMAAWLRFRAGGDAEAFLCANAGLRDLLEPMLRDAGPPAPAGGCGPGTVLGDFRLGHELGRGGMGVVFAARQLSLDRQVAVKLLLPGASLHPRALARFRREATTAAQFEHPGIVTMYAVGEQHGLHWLAMERIDGLPLDRFMERARAEDPADFVRTAVELVARVADALQFAHDAGVVHRDIKPSNVLVRPDGAPVLTDFGLARAAGLPPLSQTGEFAGTPHYVSPEQARGTAEVDARSDVFSLGVTLYELLTRQLPFGGDSTHAVLDSIQRREPPPPSRVVRSLPRQLDAVVLQALQKQPGRRYQSAALFAADLRRFLAGEPVQAVRLPAPLRLLRRAGREPLRAALLLTALLSLVLLTLQWQNGAALARGRAGMVADRVEDLLLQAILAPLAGGDKAAMLERARALLPDDPYVVALAAQAHADQQAGLRELDAFAAGGELPRPLQRLSRRLRGDSSAPALPPPADALDHYLCGEEAMRRWAAGDAGAADEAMQHMRAAVALTERPRSMYFIGLNRAARALHDATTVHTAGDALVRFWPDSAVSHCHRALAWLGEDDAVDDAELVEREAKRSLELAPDNYLGLWLLAQVATRRGDATAAAQLLQQAERQHPGPARFMATKVAHQPPPASETR